MQLIEKGLNFENTEKAFAYKSDSQLRKAKMLFAAMQITPLVKLGTWLTPWAIKAGLPVKGIIKKTLFEQFVGGETLEQSAELANTLGKYNVKLILDYAIEGGERTEEQYEKEADHFIEVVRLASQKNNIPFISIKLTGLVSTRLLEKLDISVSKNPGNDQEADFQRAVSTLSSDELKAWELFISRTDRVCAAATQAGVGIMIDAEESWIQDPIDQVAASMMEKYNRSRVNIYNTIQLYRHDRLQYMKDAFHRSVSKNYMQGLKLVRGAYMEKERKRASEMGYPSPIQPDKMTSDRDYNDAVLFCLDNIDSISMVVASHNEESTRLAADQAISRNIRPDHEHLHFSQLYGMSDNLTFNLADSGFNVLKYLPFGPVEEVIPYLMRRAQENSSISGQTGRELELIKKECSRRGK